MESKFRLSPVITLLTNQRYEDRNRSKRPIHKDDTINDRNLRSQGTATEKEKDLGGPTKFGPPNRNLSAAKKVTFNDSDEEIDQSERPAPKIRKVPYVDVPPLKATIRSKLNEPVNQDQPVNFGAAYKTKAPVEIGVDIEKLVETPQKQPRRICY